MEPPKRQLSSRQLSFKHQQHYTRQNSFRQKKSNKQLTSKRGDTPLHLSVRSGNLKEVLRILGENEEQQQHNKESMLSVQNQSGETALYVASETGFIDITRELVKHYDFESASIKSRSGYDALHVAARQGDLDTLTILAESHPELLLTTDLTNTTSLHTASSQGHIEIVNFLLNNNQITCFCLASIARNNGKTPLHSAARNGHFEVVMALIKSNPAEITMRVDKKGQTALHMAVKGHSNVEIVEVMIRLLPKLVNLVDFKGNSALHIAARKGRLQIVEKLLEYKDIEKETINRSGETPLDTADKTGHYHISLFLQQNTIRPAKSINFLPNQNQNPIHIHNHSNHFNQTVTSIKQEVHHQIHHTRKTRKRMNHIAKKLNKMQREGINNAINSSTVVAVLIASVAFAAIFSVPGQYDVVDNNPNHHLSLGEANIAPRTEFIMFFLFDSVALFISLAVVVVQTSVVIIEKKAKKMMIAIINKLLCVG